MKFQELKTKEIIRISDGKKLGYAEDIIIDEATNNVIALRVPKSTRGFRKPEYIEIPFKNINKIGENVILVGEEVCANTSVEDLSGAEFYYSPKIFRRSSHKKSNDK